MKACPKRDLLYSKLKEDKDGEPESQEELDEILSKWLSALSQIVSRIDKFYTDNNYKKGL